MTDYRMRNHDLLSADRGFRPLGWRSVVVFGSIAVTATFGIVGYLTERFNPAATGFATPAQIAQHKAPATTVQLVSKGGPSGSY